MKTVTHCNITHILHRLLSVPLWYIGTLTICGCTMYEYRIVQNSGGENFGEFGKSGAICQSFTHPNLYHKTVGRVHEK